jgi:hypothetical protein
MIGLDPVEAKAEMETRAEMEKAVASPPVRLPEVDDTLRN